MKTTIKLSVYSEEEHWFEEQDEYAAVDCNNFTVLESLPKEGNSVIVEFKVKGKEIYYAAKVIGETENDAEVNFLKDLTKHQIILYAKRAMVALKDIKMILLQPSHSGNTKGKQGMHHFDIDFCNIKLR